jgi:hypothetical protein
MECFLKIVLEVLSQIAAPCIKAFREGGEKVRGLQCRAETAEKECLEWKERCLATESQNRILRMTIALATFAWVWSIIFPHTLVLVGLFVLGVVCGIDLRPLASSLGQDSSEVTWQIRAAGDRLVGNIRSRMCDWRRKSVPVFTAFSVRPSHKSPSSRRQVHW